MKHKYQIWLNLDLVGHITGDNVTIGDAIAYAIDWRGEINPAAVSMCEISESYYQDIARSTAKDSIVLGMWFKMIPGTVLEDCIQERDAAIKVIAAVFDCDNSRVMDTIKLIHTHGDGIIELANLFLSANCSTKWDYAAMVEGVQVYVLNVIESDISEDQYFRLGDITIDTSKGVGNWKVLAHVYAYESEANVFVNMCQHGITSPSLAMLQGLDKLDVIEWVWRVVIWL